MSAERKKAQQEIDSSLVKALKADAVRRHIASAETNGLYWIVSFPEPDCLIDSSVRAVTEKYFILQFPEEFVT